MTTEIVRPDFVDQLMGEPWIELEWRKGIRAKVEAYKAPPSQGEDASARRAGGRFASHLSDTQRVKNAVRAPQAVVKIIRKGGVADRGGLNAQLDYLSRNGEEPVYGYDPDGIEDFMTGREQIRELTRDWSDEWQRVAERDGRAGRTTNKTFHLLVSFPHGTDVEKARLAADSFADAFLHSGDHGDRWRNMRAFHTDRDHPHMHIVIDRRGESGRLMQIHPGAEINPTLLRALQVNAAAEHGLLLNDTPRASRGLTSVPRTTEEWRLAQGETPERGRAEYRQTYAGLAAGFAQDVAQSEARESFDLAKRLEQGPEDLRKFAVPVQEAGQHLQNGRALTMDDMGGAAVREFTVEDVRAMDEESLRIQAVKTVRELDELAPQLGDEDDRARAEIVRDRIRTEFAHLVPEFGQTGAVPEREDGLRSVVEAHRTTEIGIEEHEPIREGEGASRETDPQGTLDDADERVRAAYEARGMKADRALARIRGGMEAEPETLEYWNDQEVRERMRAGDVPRSVAEREIAELHRYAAGTYMAAARAVDLDYALDAPEAGAPEDAEKFRQTLEPEREPDSVERMAVDAGRVQEREARSGFEDAAEAEQSEHRTAPDDRTVSEEQAAALMASYMTAREGFHAADAANDQSEWEAYHDARETLVDAAVHEPSLFAEAKALDHPELHDDLVIAKFGEDGAWAVRLNERLTDSYVSNGPEESPEYHRDLVKQVTQDFDNNPAMAEFETLREEIERVREREAFDAVERERSRDLDYGFD